MHHDRRRVLPALLAVVVTTFFGSSTLRLVRAASTAPKVVVGTPQHALPDQLWSREVSAHGGMVVTGHEAASRAAAQMLEAGGNAIDAAVAAAFALGAAEPGSSGLGGQTYIVIRLADGRAVAVDGSVRSPLRASVDELAGMRDEVLRLRPGRYLEGYKAVATPGTLAALDLALRTYGTMTLGEVIEPSIRIAELGSVWSPTLHAFLLDYSAKVMANPYLSLLFLDDRLDVWGADHVYCNPDLACFLRRLAAVGAADFYHGAISAEIEDRMIANGGFVRRADLSMLEARLVEPVRGRYRGLEVLSFPFPGGGAAVVETLGILDRLDPDLLRSDSVDRLHIIVEAGRMAYADAFPSRRPGRLPDEMAVDPAHLDRRAAQIRLDRALTEREVSVEALSKLEVGGTTQVSVVDRYGNAVSLTQTLGGTFGGGASLADFGVTLNNLLHGFEFSDRRAWSYLRPLQPPMTAMAPTIVVKGDRPLLVLGSAGSARIAAAIVNTVGAAVARGVPLCEAVSAPRALWGGNSDSQVYLELADPITEEQADALARRGFSQQTRLSFPATDYELTDFGGVNAIWVDPIDGTLVGVGDPRRHGVATATAEAAGACMPIILPPCWRDLYDLPAAASTLPRAPASPD